jgi:hypothetical protein
MSRKVADVATTKRRGDETRINRTDTERTNTDRDNGAKKGKTPSKPVSLYPMSEEEALRRLLRVPPPEKDTGTAKSR